MERILLALPVSESELEVVIEALGCLAGEFGLRAEGEAVLERARELRELLREARR